MSVYHAAGTVVGYYAQQPTSKPPGSTDTEVFDGSNTVVLSEPSTRKSITMTHIGQ